MSTKGLRRESLSSSSLTTATSLSSSSSEQLIQSSSSSTTTTTITTQSTKRRESLTPSSPSSELSTKNGYLFKCAKVGSKYWSKKFFLLKGFTLNYYNDHNSLYQSKGELLLTTGTIISNKEVDGMKFCFLIKTPQLEEILVAAKSIDERASWKQAILDAISKYNSNILKCSINIITSSNKLKTMGARKYFVFDRDSLLLQQYCDKDSDIVESTFLFNKDTIIDVLFKFKRLTLIKKDNDTKEVISLQFNKNEEQEFILWHDCFMSIIEAHRTLPPFELEESSILKTGVLSMRSNTGEWPQVELVLTNNNIIIRDIHEKVLEWYSITADVFVYETTFSAYSFEIVTVKKIIHFSASSDVELSSWFSVLRSFENVRNDYEDSIVKYALKKCKRDIYYEMTIADAKPLGIVLEKSGENWAIIKSVTSKEHESKLKVASCLASINGENTLFLRYNEVMDRLRDWKPPLTLTFRIARDKKGFLKKRSVTQGDSGATTYSWKSKYCIMTEGTLVFKDDDNASSKQRGEVQLMGASVQLMSFRESGQFYCFRIYSGIMSLVLAASSLNDMIDWVANIHHLICICNGGGHIRRYEIDRQLREERQKAIIADANAADANADTWEEIEEEEEEEEEDLDDNDSKLASHIAPPVMPILPPPIPQIEKNTTTATVSIVQTETDDSIVPTSVTEPIKDLSDQESILSSVLINQKEPENFEATYEEDKEDDYVIVNDVHETISEERDDHVIFVDNEQEQEEGDDEDNDEIAESDTLSPVKESVKNEVLATQEDLKKVYGFYSKNGIEGMKDGRYINVMTFSAIWRIVSGEKGNLFQEMQLFNKFDRKKEGYMVEEDFVNGFLSLANDKSLKESEKGKKYLVKFKKMLGETGTNLLL